jgi:hypothetical protein
VLGCVEAAFFAVRGDRHAASSYVAAIWWNVRHANATKNKRRIVQLSRTRSDSSLRGFVGGSNKLKLVRAVGAPQIAKSDPA